MTKMKLAPSEPTEEQLLNATKVTERGRGTPYAIYKAMLANCQEVDSEPFGYFKAEPFGWTDCAETDEGAIALYDKPQPDRVAELEALIGGDLSEWLKEDETVIKRLEREHKDVCLTLSRLAKEQRKNEELEAKLKVAVEALKGSISNATVIRRRTHDAYLYTLASSIKSNCEEALKQIG